MGLRAANGDIPYIYKTLKFALEESNLIGVFLLGRKGCALSSAFN